MSSYFLGSKSHKDLLVDENTDPALSYDFLYPSVEDYAVSNIYRSETIESNQSGNLDNFRGEASKHANRIRSTASTDLRGQFNDRGQSNDHGQSNESEVDDTASKSSSSKSDKSKSDKELHPAPQIDPSSKSNSSNKLVEAVSLKRSEFEGSQESSSVGFPNVLISYKSGLDGGLVKCELIRHKGGLMKDEYEMRLQSLDQVILYAVRSKLSRTSNILFYDMTRGEGVANLSTKSSNFIAKLKSVNLARSEYTLVTSGSDREELAGFVYDHENMLDPSEEYTRPRKLFVLLPTLDNNGSPKITDLNGEDLGPSLNNFLRSNDQLKSINSRNILTLCSKEPSLINDSYRLNFNGRVKVPSVKNFQLICRGDENTVIMQFGKVGTDKFHLDFKAPLNATQAFAIALSQFIS